MSQPLAKTVQDAAERLRAIRDKAKTATAAAIDAATQAATTPVTPPASPGGGQ